LRGVRAAATAVEGLETADGGAVLAAAAAALRRSAGGASGPLFASVLSELGRAVEGESLGLAGFAHGLDGAAALVTKLGKATVGDRTMLDALVPAAEAARVQPDLSAALTAAAIAADEGVAATATMVACRGRARFVNAGQVASPDAGATSIALMLQALREVAAP